MNVIVGDREKLAIECVELKPDLPKEGRLFLYVNGIRFGDDSIDFEVDAAILHTLKYFKLDADLPNLYECPTKELVDSFKMVDLYELGEIEEYAECPAQKYMPDFIERFVDIDNCVFRYVQYAFDKCLIILIRAGEKLKVHIQDDDSGHCECIATTFEEFCALWKELATERGLEILSGHPS